MTCNEIEEKRMMHPILGLALAAGTILAAPAWALDLTLYGVGHLSGDHVDLDADSSGYLHSNSSRLGPKGSHDFGNGLAVVYQHETGVALVCLTQISAVEFGRY